MAGIRIHQGKARDPRALIEICPFKAIEFVEGELAIGAGCRMCRLCLKHPDGVFELVEHVAPGVDKSRWRGVAVAAELSAGHVHPVAFELLGKARELADKIGQPVYAFLPGRGLEDAARRLAAHGADEVFVYDDPALEHFRIEPHAAALADFIDHVRPGTVLVGGTASGRSLAPRVAARFRTGLTADCTFLDMAPSTDLDQIRPAYGGNIMAHINTPRHRPQFATVRYKVFSAPAPGGTPGKITRRALPESGRASGIEVLSSAPKARESGIEDAEVLVVAGRGLRRREDLEMIEALAAELGGLVAGTRSLIEAGWVDPRRQIGLSGRTVKPKLIVTCAVSGAIQFAAGMSGAETIVAINSDPDANIFKLAHLALVGDVYGIVPGLVERLRARKK